ncbi:MAG: methyltransferase domain-containing protein [Acidimicrobiaceae bacterium]|nr:methyltransferase domain-containing protein [Acidimicrobiaceae bacterium]MBO0747604.1 methyltransferase domain-containing protein [Acidimicrobiaceae bacterium]
MPADRRVRWGYHELTEPWAHRLVKGAGIRPGELVMDIGAGQGSITAHLIDVGARIIAVELHPARAGRLRQRFGSSIVVVEADAADLRLPRQPFKVVANPPFGITTGLFRRLLGRNSRLSSADVVVPAHVAARLASGRAPGADRWTASYRAHVAARLPARAFRPPAPMATSVLRIDRHSRTAADPNAPPQAHGPGDASQRLECAADRKTLWGTPNVVTGRERDPLPGRP